MQESGAKAKLALFFGFWLFIIFVSVVDGYLVVRHRDDLLRSELNPVGRYLILLNGGRVWGLLGAKFAGTVVACSLLLLMYGKNTRLGITVAAALAALQLCLLLFLYFA